MNDERLIQPVSVHYRMNSPSTLNIVFTGGGTAGHLFPGLAVAERLVEETPYARVTFLGSGKPLECGSVASAGFDYLALPCLPMPRRWREVVPSLWTNAAGYFAVRDWFARNACDVVVGLGGYASAAAARAAVDARIPLVLLEQNAVPGRVTRWLAARAAAVCVAFEQARLPAGCRVLVTGNPIRPGFARAIEAGNPVLLNAAKNLASRVTTEILRGDPADAPRRLLILGGSAGAQSLNRAVPKALDRTRERLQGWEIVHQSGSAGLSETRELYSRLGLKAAVVPFVVEMPAMLAGADLAICRAGGTTLAELAAAGVPAVLIPYPHAADQHQRLNAHVLVQQGAALMLDEGLSGTDLDVRLADILAQVLDDLSLRRQMGLAMRRRARPNAAADVAAVIRRIKAGRPKAQGGMERPQPVAA